jgi:hypothetical protein
MKAQSGSRVIVKVSLQRPDILIEVQTAFFSPFIAVPQTRP